MRICHVSDTHGPIRFDALPRPSDFDVLVHSGDWFPEPGSHSRADVVPYQQEFLRHEGAALAAWLDGRPFVFCLGNHDLLSEDYVERVLRGLGVNAFAPGPRGVVVPAPHGDAVCFRGFRETPFISPAFEGGCDDVELAVRTQSLADKWHPRDVLVAHCPPSGPLSMKKQWGNRHLAMALAGDQAPRLVLVGHVHDRGGREETIGHSRVINSACTAALVDSCEWPMPGRRAVG